MAKNNKTVIIIVSLFILILLIYVAVVYNKFGGVGINTTENKKMNDTELALGYTKDMFNSLTIEEKTLKVEKLQFSTCFQISDFCSNETYNQLKGCQYCNK